SWCSPSPPLPPSLLCKTSTTYTSIGSGSAQRRNGTFTKQGTISSSPPTRTQDTMYLRSSHNQTPLIKRVSTRKQAPGLLQLHTRGVYLRPQQNTTTHACTQQGQRKQGNNFLTTNSSLPPPPLPSSRVNPLPAVLRPEQDSCPLSRVP
ncbi:unnamed protein product, partial [Ectocarpus sp. 8 AP-2014]